MILKTGNRSRNVRICKESAATVIKMRAARTVSAVFFAVVPDMFSAFHTTRRLDVRQSGLTFPTDQGIPRFDRPVADRAAAGIEK